MPTYPLTFLDADFEHRFAWRASSDGRRVRRWEPFGMPRLNPAFTSAVFFLYARSPMTGEIEGPCGTGVLVGMSPSNLHPSPDWIRHVYAVTCKHVSVTGGASIIRINTKDGKSRYIEFDPHEWKFLNDAGDISALDVTDFLENEDDIYCVHDSLIGSKEFIHYSNVTVGEDGFMLGLFADLPGKARNMVAARFGNISLLADDNERIKQPNGNRRPSHLFDMHSRPGFSGSPVFCFRTPGGDLRTADQRGRDKSLFSTFGSALAPDFQSARERWDRQDNTFLVLLGIHAGQFHDRVKIEKSVGFAAESNIAVIDGDLLDVPNSMALVVPAWEIADLLEIDFFKSQREAREMLDKKTEENHAQAEAIPLPSAPAAGGIEPDNPDHREAFTALVSKASKTKPQAD